MPSAPLMRWEKLVKLGQRARLFLAKGPAYHYTYGRWRLDGWWRKRNGSLANVSDEAFFAQLALQKPGLAGVEKALREQNKVRARSELTAYFQSRNQPRFHFDGSARDRIVALVPRVQQEATIHAADQICQNIFAFRRSKPVQFENGVDWAFRPGGNTDWTWDLNRHAYFITLGQAFWYTGEAKYAQKFVTLLLDWIRANPAGVGRRNWDSVLEVAIRLNAWIWAYFLFRQADLFGPDAQTTFFKSLFTHARYLAARIERHAVNNHLLFEAKALALCGFMFPEFKDASQWQSLLGTLWKQVDKQVCTDGVHAERAPLYHRCVLSELVEILALLDHNNQPVPEFVVDRVQKMLDFERHITKPDGTLPLFSDSALTDVLARFVPRGGGATLFGRLHLGQDAPDEEMAWLLGGWALDRPAVSQETARPFSSRAFTQGGYYVMRAGEQEQQLYLAFDCGPFGYRPLPIHGHADALSFVLYAYSRSLLVDSGVYSYHMGAKWRNYFRGTRAHNTIVVDQADQSALLGVRHVYRPAQTTLHQWITGRHFDFVDGSHDGYRRLRDPITHRRQIFFVKADYWIVTDWLTGRGHHRFDLLFHLPPQANPELDEADRVTFRTEDGVGLNAAPLFPGRPQAEIITGATNPIQGWVSRHSGEKLPAPVVRYALQATAPVSFCTVLFPYRSGTAPSIDVTQLTVKANDTILSNPSHSDIIAARIESEDYVDYWVVDRHAGNRRKAFADYETDGRLLHLRTLSTGPSRVVMLDGRRLAQGGIPLIDQAEPKAVIEWTG